MAPQAGELAGEAYPAKPAEEVGQVGDRRSEQGIGILAVEQRGQAALPGRFEQDGLESEVHRARRLTEATEDVVELVQRRVSLDRDGAPRDAVQLRGLPGPLSLVAPGESVEDHRHRDA